MQSVEKKVIKAIDRYGVNMYYKDDRSYTPYRGILILRGKRHSEVDTLYGKNGAADYHLFTPSDHLMWMKKGKLFSCPLGYFIIRDFAEVYFKGEIVCLKAVVQNLVWEEKYDD